MHTYINTHTLALICVCTRACVCACMRVCACLHVFVLVCVCTTHLYIKLHIKRVNQTRQRRSVPQSQNVLRRRWRLLNETLTDHVTSKGLTSFLRLPATAESRGTYYCYVNNTIGESIPCEIDVTGEDGGSRL